MNGEETKVESSAFVTIKVTGYCINTDTKNWRFISFFLQTKISQDSEYSIQKAMVSNM